MRAPPTSPRPRCRRPSLAGSAWGQRDVPTARGALSDAPRYSHCWTSIGVASRAPSPGRRDKSRPPAPIGVAVGLRSTDPAIIRSVLTGTTFRLAPSHNVRRFGARRNNVSAALLPTTSGLAARHLQSPECSVYQVRTTSFPWSGHSDISEVGARSTARAVLAIRRERPGRPPRATRPRRGPRRCRRSVPRGRPRAAAPEAHRSAPRHFRRLGPPPRCRPRPP